MSLSSFFLWFGLTLFVILPALPAIFSLSLAGLLMVVGMVLLVLDK